MAVDDKLMNRQKNEWPKSFRHKNIGGHFDKLGRCLFFKDCCGGILYRLVKLNFYFPIKM